MQEVVINAVDGHQYTWIDIVGPTRDELNALAAVYGLHQLMVRDCLDPLHLPKYERYEEWSFLILRSFDSEAEDQASSVRRLTRKLAVFVSTKIIITIHRTDQPYLKNLRDYWRNKAATGQSHTVFHPLNHILQSAVQSFDLALEKCRSDLEKVEAKTFLRTERPSLEGETAYRLIRKTTVIRRMMRMTADAIHKLDALPNHDYLYFKDVEEDAESKFMAASDLVDNSNRIIQMQLALIGQYTNEASHKTNETMRFLTVLSVFFMPLNLVTGVFGMNFEIMPAVKAPNGFWLICGYMMVAAVAVLIFFFQRGWLKAEK
jgi:magnesium transporter